MQRMIMWFLFLSGRNLQRFFQKHRLIFFFQKNDMDISTESRDSQNLNLYFAHKKSPIVSGIFYFVTGFFGVEAGVVFGVGVDSGIVIVMGSCTGMRSFNPSIRLSLFLSSNTFI